MWASEDPKSGPRSCAAIAFIAEPSRVGAGTQTQFHAQQALSSAEPLLQAPAHTHVFSYCVVQASLELLMKFRQASN